MLSRRRLLKETACGFGYLALAGLCAEQAKAAAMELISDTSATKVTLPFVEENLKAARALMGEDFWPYGVAANRKTLEAFLQRHHAEGLSSRLVKVDEMFHPSTYESFKV